MTIREASQHIRLGELSPVERVRSCLDRMDAVDDRIRAWVVVDREGALSAAKEAEAEIRAGRWRGPLHGIPLGIKDIVDVRGLPTRAGARLLADAPPADQDATVVSRLREAGGVILGKTVTTEFACFDPSDTRNPWNLAHTPGGSSSGSAAAVASGMCLGAIGSQTGGSISRPAAYCGVVGCKPTHGRVSAHGFVPVSFSLDHPGPFARSVADAALLLRAMAGYDPRDPVSAPEPVADYVAACAPGEGAPRIGMVGGLFLDRADEDVRRGLEKARQAFETCGATVTGARMPEAFGEVHRMHRILMCADLAAYHQAQFQDRKADYRPGIRGLIEEGLALSAVDGAGARWRQIRFKGAIQETLRGVDVLLTPAAPTPAPQDLTTTGDPVFNSPWSYAGLPTIVLPVALARNGLPVAVQLVGRAFREADLFRVAAWAEKAIGFNARPPEQPS
ncbi:MAG: amidase [Candidatus Latescibacteria bacterium]|nr:amidase [Candidatus Latescibacterota bacterium]